MEICEAGRAGTSCIWLDTSAGNRGYSNNHAQVPVRIVLRAPARYRGIQRWPQRCPPEPRERPKSRVSLRAEQLVFNLTPRSRRGRIVVVGRQTTVELFSKIV